MKAIHMVSQLPGKPQITADNISPLLFSFIWLSTLPDSTSVLSATKLVQCDVAHINKINYLMDKALIRKNRVNFIMLNLFIFTLYFQ